MDEQDHEAFYDDRWADFSYANRLELMRCAAILSELACLKMDNPRILDIGCGAGWLTAILGQFGPTKGMELSSEAVRAASDRYKHVHFEHVDLRSWSPDEYQFDVVVSQEVLEHLEDQSGHLRTIKSLLRPGGGLILTTPNARTMAAMPDDVARTWSQQPLENWVDKRTLRKLVSDAGLRLRLVTTIIPGVGNKGPYRVFNSVKVKALMDFLRLGRLFDQARLWMGFGLHILTVAENPAEDVNSVGSSS